MGITGDMSGIGDYLNKQIENRVKALIYNLNKIGMSCVNKARIEGSYTDRSSNLRKSTGYVIVRDGTIVEGSKFDSTEGGAKGEAYIKKLAAGHPHGIVLIVVAGMNYASHVEALNYDVLSGAELLAEQLVPTLMKQLGFGV